MPALISEVAGLAGAGRPRRGATRPGAAAMERSRLTSSTRGSASCRLPCARSWTLRSRAGGCKRGKGRLVIGNIGLLTHTFLPAALAAFRELFPLVEVTVTGGFEPYIESIANSSEDMISMVSAGRGVWLAPEIAVPGRLDALNYQRLDAIERRLEVSGNRFTSTRHSSLLPSPATTNPDPPSHSRRLPLRDRAAGLPSAVAHQPRSRPPMRAARLSIRVSA